MEAELKMEFAYASRVSAPQPRQASATSGLEEWKETVRAELRKEMKDQLNVLREALTEEIKRQLSPQTNPVVHRDVTPPPRGGGRYTPPPRHPQTFEWDQWGQPIFRVCGKAGHIQRRCPERRQLN